LLASLSLLCFFTALNSFIPFTAMSRKRSFSKMTSESSGSDAPDGASIKHARARTVLSLSASNSQDLGRDESDEDEPFEVKKQEDEPDADSSRREIRNTYKERVAPWRARDMANRPSSQTEQVRIMKQFVRDTHDALVTVARATSDIRTTTSMANAICEDLPESEGKRSLFFWSLAIRPIVNESIAAIERSSDAAKEILNDITALDASPIEEKISMTAEGTQLLLDIERIWMDTFKSMKISMQAATWAKMKNRMTQSVIQMDRHYVKCLEDSTRAWDFINDLEKE
jgi:hypothetical protein